MKIVILEADSLGQDMVFTPFEALGEVVIYPTTTADEMEEKTKDADVIVANKVPICESTIGKAQNLKKTERATIIKRQLFFFMFWKN